MGVSFHPETGSQHLAFQQPGVLRCIDQYTARQYRHQSGQKEALAFARTSSCTSKTVSRVLYQTVIYLDVPVEPGLSSRTAFRLVPAAVRPARPTILHILLHRVKSGSDLFSCNRHE